MSTSRFSVLLADANRQVQIADHLLTVTFPSVNDPKLLLSVMEHGRRALEDASDAVVEYHVSRGEYELPQAIKHGKHDPLLAFSDLLRVRRPQLASAEDAVKLCHDLRQTLSQHKEAHTAFKREDKLVIADNGFEFLKEVTPAELKRSLSTIKAFVHAANQHVR